MIQLNLLPDIKLDYIKAQRQRKLVVSVAVLVTVASVTLLILLFSFNRLQSKHLSDLTKDINSESTTLQQKPDINKILTVQNQLGSLTALHASKPAAAQLFDYLNRVTPAQDNITNLEVDFTQQTAIITGTANALASVNKYIDTLKFTTYTTDNGTTNNPAFSNIVLTNFGLNSDTHDPSQAATYTINLNYDKNIFDITQTVKLTVPNQTTTRASLDNPSDLFKASAPSKGAQ